MTLLTVWPDDDTETLLHRTTDEAGIRAVLAPLGVRFERWPLAEVRADAGPDELLLAYEAPAERLIAADGHRGVDVLVGSPEDAGELRAELFAERTQDGAGAQFFARGAGVLYLHARRKVHALLCGPGDLVGLPDRATHWYDVSPDFAVIRFFPRETGPGGPARVGTVTGSPIAGLFPDLGTLRAGSRASAAQR